MSEQPTMSNISSEVMQKDMRIRTLEQTIKRLEKQLANCVTPEQLQLAQLQDKLEREREKTQSEREKNQDMTARLSSLERDMSDLRLKVPAQGTPGTYSPLGAGLHFAHSPVHYPPPPPWGSIPTAGSGPRQPPVPLPLPSVPSRLVNPSSSTQAPCTPKAAPLAGLGTPASVGSPSAGANSAASARSGYAAASTSSNPAAAVAVSPVRNVAPELSLAASSPLGNSNSTRMQALHNKVEVLASLAGVSSPVCSLFHKCS
jgi:hypothetical protein